MHKTLKTFSKSMNRRTGAVQAEKNIVSTNHSLKKQILYEPGTIQYDLLYQTVQGGVGGTEQLDLAGFLGNPDYIKLSSSFYLF